MKILRITRLKKSFIKNLTISTVRVKLENKNVFETLALLTKDLTVIINKISVHSKTKNEAIEKHNRITEICRKYKYAYEQHRAIAKIGIKLSNWYFTKNGRGTFQFNDQCHKCNKCNGDGFLY